MLMSDARSRYYLIIGACRQQINDEIYQREAEIYGCSADNVQRDARQEHYPEYLKEYGRGDDGMYPRYRERQEEYEQHLRAYGCPHLAAAHAYLLHYLIAVVILVALGYLLIIDYQHRCKEEHNTEQQTEEKQHTVHAVHVVAGAVYRALRKTDGYRIAVFFLSSSPVYVR